MSQPATRKMTTAEFSALPETVLRQELVGGELIMTPAPTWGHQRIVWKLGTVLFNFVEAQGLGEVIGSPVDVILSDTDVVQPDIVFVSKARQGRVVRGRLRGAPDLAVEVLSPTTRRMDIGPKLALYAQHGVVEYWIVDPKAKTVDVYRFAEDAERPRARLSAKDTLATALMPGLSIPLAGVFAGD